MFGGGGEDALAARLGMVTPSLMNPATSLVMSGEVSVAVREERGPAQPQWSQQETREFIAIRAELERDFTASKRNKTLWEVVSSKMRERGFRRSPEQCKCKWKNLVNRYKVFISFLFSVCCRFRLFVCGVFIVLDFGAEFGIVVISLNLFVDVQFDCFSVNWSNE